MTPILVINGDEVSELLTMPSCIKVMEAVLTDLAQGRATQSLRAVVPTEKNNVLGLMPGYLIREKIVGTKVITVYDENHKQGLPSHQGVVLLFDAANGKPLATVDATKITAIRTAAVSAVATKLLASQNAGILSLLGSGEQAKSHLEAIFQTRPIKKVNVWSRNIGNAQAFKAEMSSKYDVPIQVYETSEEAVYNADIICTLTASKVPILKKEWVKPGTHINAVGACRASDRELDSGLVKKSKFYVDRRESTINESGDFLIPLREGEIQDSHIIGEIGELLLSNIDGRSAIEDITIFESLGLAIEDLAAAHFIYQEAVRLHIGTDF